MSRDRFLSYRKLKAENAYLENSESYLAAKEKNSGKSQNITEIIEKNDGIVNAVKNFAGMEAGTACVEAFFLSGSVI